MLNEWDITHKRMDLPPEVWKFIREKGFLGIIIPKAYGGLGFSAFAHSEIVTKISTRSGTAAVTVMVPELARARRSSSSTTAPRSRRTTTCRASPRAWRSRASRSPTPRRAPTRAPSPTSASSARACTRAREVLGMRLTWEKRYITLGPVATLLGLAFKLFDPDKLLGGKEDLGITLALIPTTHKGVNIGRRHIPLGAAFMNGPNWGKDVFIPMDWVIGGEEQVGKGWRMLVECLAAGRSISLPSMSMAAGKLGCARHRRLRARAPRSSRCRSASSRASRRPLARIGGNTYMMDAARRMTMGALDLGREARR